MTTMIEARRERLEQVGFVGQRLLQIHELNSDDLVVLNNCFLERVKVLSTDDLTSIYGAYTAVLHEFGIMCPHTQSFRLYGGQLRSDSPVPFAESHWFDCQLCGAAVINR